MNPQLPPSPPPRTAADYLTGALALYAVFYIPMLLALAAAANLWAFGVVGVAYRFMCARF